MTFAFIYLFWWDFFLGGFWANIFLLDFMYKFNICYIVFDSVVHTHGSNFKGTKGIWGRAFSYLFPQPLRSHPNLAISVPRIHPEVVHWCTLNNIARCHMLVHKELSPSFDDCVVLHCVDVFNTITDVASPLWWKV